MPEAAVAAVAAAVAVAEAALAEAVPAEAVLAEAVLAEAMEAALVEAVLAEAMEAALVEVMEAESADRRVHSGADRVRATRSRHRRNPRPASAPRVRTIRQEALSVGSSRHIERSPTAAVPSARRAASSAAKSDASEHDLQRQV
jgi:hypothetical protein